MRHALVILMCLLPFTACSAEQGAPRYGGWRAMYAAVGDDAQYAKERVFLMLPENAAKGDKFTVLDSKRNRAICCLVTESSELDREVLKREYGLSGVQVTDLTNGWNMDEAPYKPRIYLAKRSAELERHSFDPSDRTQSMGGLLLSADARIAVGNGVVSMAGSTYRVDRALQNLADDDGAVETFKLTKTTDPKSSLVVEVPYGTN